MNAPTATGPDQLARLDAQVCWQDKEATVTIAGELDCGTTPVLSACLNEVVAGHPERVTLDLAGVAFMDCGGFRPITRARRALPESCPLVLRSPTPRVRKFLALADVEQLGGLKVG